ncbi:M1 family peptidase [Nitzschia inconspicua]|uniref:M1 family peptidase n=1 Tax=Nitzschia inconspicua TaxID=303405 RepID=A0A9K3PQV8_9STRA|nr:M1 family peptidase [Nitzschia inconspicua]
MDLSSFSKPEEAVVTHLDWVLTVDFEEKCLVAKATCTVRKSRRNIGRLILDTAHLEISAVQSCNGSPLDFKLHSLVRNKEHLGRQLEIQLPEQQGEDDTVKVTILYRTTEQCSALQWLPPSQTAGKQFPYLFTQCQAIHARSLVPCQDRCGVKMTYNATVTVPKWSTAVMSALFENVEMADENHKVYAWKQPVPISSYLLALAVGELTKKEISKRCAIWSEPSVVDAAAWEFSETEDFLTAAEVISGKTYVWGRYDLLCLPPSFPYGGMENPCLTFVTPTLLAGDKSLADVVAHEIAHSWTGNLVTNATWDHFWLNEGWTTWLQRKIMVRIKNNPKFLDFDAIEGRKSLTDTIQHEMAPQNTSLVLKIGDADPDDSYSTVAYEKGFTLLLYLERLVGTPEFENFFKAYIQRFATQTLTSEDFRDFFMDYFKGNEKVEKVDWDTWLYGQGMPPILPQLDQSMAKGSADLASIWLAVDRENKAPPAKNEMASWSSLQIVCFLDFVQVETADKPLQVSTLQAMNALYHFAESRNSEILFRYCKLAISSEDASILPVAIRFITTQGRMKFVRPLYKSLYRSAFGKDLAVKTFLNNQDFYHPIAAKMIAADLKVARRSTLLSSLSVIDPWVLVVGAAVVGGVAVAALRKK